VRRLALLLFVFAWPAQSLADTPAPAPTLTLKAPGATTFGHRIELDGRLMPAVPGARIALFRGDVFVTASAARADGTFRIPVRLARPGPFHVGWAGTVSSSVTVQIHPLLRVKLVGAPVVGKRLTVAVSLRPADAGAIRVRVKRSGAQTLERRVRGAGRVPVATRSQGRVAVLVDTVPRPGFVRVSKELGVTLQLPLITYGSSGPAVAELLRELAALHYAVPRIQQSFDGDVLESVYAFEKVQGLPRDGRVDVAFWARLARPRIASPRYSEPADHLEVDKEHQVLYVVRGGQVALVSPVSTAGIPGYYTPVGRFAIYRKVPGYDPSPLGILYKPMYFVGGYAIHGNPSVPPYPASHGCVRVPNFVIERLYYSEPYGETVYVY
jgi:L,D-transpeptidase catalytic domain/Putative peptidoglycan binding domain